MHIELILARKGRDVRTIEPTVTVSEALRRMRAERIGALVVLEDGARIVGILTDRRILNAIADQGPAMLEVPVTEVMTREVVTCSRRERVDSVMALMTERRIRYVPVMEEGGRLCGIVSIGDAVKHRLEEMRHEVDALREHIKSIL
jgi:CBS domain-containing protein